MAEILARYSDVELLNKQPTSLEKSGFNPMLNSSLDETELNISLY